MPLTSRKRRREVSRPRYAVNLKEEGRRSLGLVMPLTSRERREASRPRYASVLTSGKGRKVSRPRYAVNLREEGEEGL